MENFSKKNFSSKKFFDKKILAKFFLAKTKNRAKTILGKKDVLAKRMSAKNFWN